MFSGLILLTFLASISTSKSIPSVYIQLFQRLHAEITENFDDCTPQLIFHFSTNGMYTNTDWFPLLQKRLLTTSMKRSNGYVTAIVTDMEANNATLMHSIKDPVRFRYHCSLVLIEIGTLLTKNIRSEGDDFNQEYFQENLLQLTRNVEEPFYIYFSSSEVDLIPSFLKVTAVTHRKIFVIPNEGKVNVLKQTPGIIDQVYLLQSFEQESFDISKEIFCNQWEDFQGRSLVIAACPLCESSYQEAKRLKIWTMADLAIIDEVKNRVNSTVELQIVFSMPLRERNDDEEWDEYTRLLIDGSAAIATMAIASASKSLVVYITRPYVYDGAIFLVSLPRKVKAGSLIVLKDPLETNVWVAFFISIALMIACLQFQLIMSTHSQHRTAQWQVIPAIILPILDQMAVISGDVKSAWSSVRVRLLVGLWLLSLIVLSCAYKCHLISAIVIPQYVMPPRTFLELSQSHYELGAVFFTGLLEMDLEASNTSMGKEFIRRMQEYNYLSPECYQTIFEGDKACFAYSTLVDSFSEQFLVDIYGHGMYYKSLDSHFAGHMGLGVSKFFPGILEPINNFISWSESSGLTQLYYRIAKTHTKIIGRRNAKNWVSEKPFYRGVGYQKDSTLNGQFKTFLKQLVLAGSLLAVSAFVLEVLLKITKSKRWYDSAERVYVMQKFTLWQLSRKITTGFSVGSFPAEYFAN